jgi:hypothetical protein
MFLLVSCRNYRTLTRNRPLIKLAATYTDGDLAMKDAGWFGLFIFGLVCAFPITSCGGGGGSSSPTPTPNPALAITVSSGNFTVYAGTTFSLTVTATATGTMATPTVTLGTLPAGFSSTSSFPMSVTTSGAQITLICANTVTPGSYPISIAGNAGSATAGASFTVTIQSGTPPKFYFTEKNPNYMSEVAIAAGGSGQLQLQSFTELSLPAYYQVQLSISGLPSGTTASFTPQYLNPGELVTVTISASNGAPMAQNAVVTVTGTPLAQVPVQTVSFLVDVSGPGGALPNNRTDYVSTEGTPDSAVYDPLHELIFASNPAWNRIDVISNVSHKVVKSVPVMSPRGIDITQDDSQVWVSTASQAVYSVDTTSFAATRYVLPDFSLSSNALNKQWNAREIFALADGTFFLNIMPGTMWSTDENGVIWDRTTNSLTGLRAPLNAQASASWQIVLRSGDAKLIYSICSNSGGQSFWYDVMSKTMSPPIQMSGFAHAAAVNFDGSQVAVSDGAGLNMYDGNLNLIGALPGGGLLSPNLFGGLVFSPDNSTLYEESMPLYTPLIYNIDTRTLLARGVAPAMPMIPSSVIYMSPSFYFPTPFGVDKNGIVLGIQNWGIAFEDATFFQNFVVSQPGTPSFMQHMSPYAGPLSGGTSSSGFGNALAMTPNVWYGANLGTAALSNGIPTITSPPASAPGPVNLKFLFANGVEVFDPLFFTYGSVPQYAVLSGASPDGNLSSRITGFGLPTDPSGGTVSVGGSTATITTQKGQYLPLNGEAFPTTFLDFTVPPGTPGWADIEVSTPNGKGTLPKSFFYAQSVKDYSTQDTLNAVLYDARRQQLYLSAQDHIDVFSLSSNQFVAPLTPPSQGSVKLFTGMALSPDGSLLLAADLEDGSLAVINPDDPAASYAISITPAVGADVCRTGPLYVAAANNQTAWVVTGGRPAIACGPGGVVYQVDLVARSRSTLPNLCGGGNVAASHDGSTIVFGGSSGQLCTYDVAHNVFSAGVYSGATAAISGDGNIAAAQWTFLDPSAHAVGTVARPEVYYPTSTTAALSSSTLMLQPQLNDSGSLYYVPAAGFVDLIDVQHGTLRMRFALKEAISDVPSPIAVDSGGQHIYLITNQGLTIVDLGTAPLSIGHLNPGVASTGYQVTVRGSGFTTGLTATLGGSPASVNRVDENTLTLTVPVMAPHAGPQDLVLTRSDGTSYTLENALNLQ